MNNSKMNNSKMNNSKMNNSEKYDIAVNIDFDEKNSVNLNNMSNGQNRVLNEVCDDTCNDVKLYEKIPEIETGFPVKIRKYCLKRLNPHWHEHLELLYMLDGEAEFKCGRKTVKAKKGEMVAVNRNEQHSFEADEKAEYICIIISPSFFKNVSFDNVVLCSKIGEDLKIGKIVAKMYDLYLENSDGDDMEIMAYAYMLMAYLKRNYVYEKMTPDEYVSRIEKIKKVNLVLDYIHINYNKGLTTKELAKRLYISTGYLCHIFKDVVGKTPIEYINEFRIEKAAIMLKNTDESIKKIAEEAGFENLNYFDKIFLRLKGTSPMKYRNGI